MAGFEYLGLYTLVYPIGIMRIPRPPFRHPKKRRDDHKCGVPSAECGVKRRTTATVFGAETRRTRRKDWGRNGNSLSWPHLAGGLVRRALPLKRQQRQPHAETRRARRKDWARNGNSLSWPHLAGGLVRRALPLKRQQRQPHAETRRTRRRIGLETANGDGGNPQPLVSPVRGGCE